MRASASDSRRRRRRWRWSRGAIPRPSRSSSRCRPSRYRWSCSIPTPSPRLAAPRDLAQRTAVPRRHAGGPLTATGDSSPRSRRRGSRPSCCRSQARARPHRRPSLRRPASSSSRRAPPGRPSRASDPPRGSFWWSRPSPRPTGSRGAPASPHACRWPPRSGSARTSSCPLISAGMSACSSASTTAPCSTSSRRASTSTGPAPR